MHFLDSLGGVFDEGIFQGVGNVLIEQINIVAIFLCTAQVDCILMRNSLQLVNLHSQFLMLLPRPEEIAFFDVDFFIVQA